MTLIEQLSNGKAYVKNDCTPEEMLSILETAFPKCEDNNITNVEDIIYHLSANCVVGFFNSAGWVHFYKDEPEYEKAISAKEFLKEIQK